MYLIKKKRVLHDSIFLMDIVAPRVAQYCQPGQFVIVRIDELGERIPLTVCDYDREEGTVTIVVQTIGASTLRMKELNEGEYLHDFVGPLGCPSEFCNEPLDELKRKSILFVAGGVGTGVAVALGSSVAVGLSVAAGVSVAVGVSVVLGASLAFGSSVAIGVCVAAGASVVVGLSVTLGVSVAGGLSVGAEVSDGSSGFGVVTTPGSGVA